MVGTARSAPLPTLGYLYAFVMPGLVLGIHETTRHQRHTFNLSHPVRLADISTAPTIG
jgi:hypothetical protein